MPARGVIMLFFDAYSEVYSPYGSAGWTGGCCLDVLVTFPLAWAGVQAQDRLWPHFMVSLVGLFVSCAELLCFQYGR